MSGVHYCCQDDDVGSLVGEGNSDDDDHYDNNQDTADLDGDVWWCAPSYPDGGVPLLS